MLISVTQDLFEVGAVAWVATHAVLAIKTQRRELKGRLRGAWDSVSSWNLMRAVNFRVPLPRVLRMALERFAVLSAVSLVFVV